MRRFLEIIGSSFKMALSEFRSNKLRTFLSLLGVTFGIFCIIGVLATVGSLEQNVQNDIKSLGSNSVYVDKWDYTGQIPWWKLTKRPVPKYEELALLKKKMSAAKHVAFKIDDNSKIEYGGDAITGVNFFGVSEEFSDIQKIEIEQGRYLIQGDFDFASNSLVMGYTVAENLFGNAAKAVGSQVEFNGRKANVVGLIKKQGQSMVGGWDFDNCVIVSYGYLKTMVKEEYSSPLIIVQGKDHVPIAQVLDELRGAMRSIRKLRPTEIDNFSLNDIDSFSDFAKQIFSGVNKGGWAIAALSLFVGMFGVANIMFVTVRERTSQIGLKKALGAKKRVILSEFLLESAFLCIMGGVIGLILVFILTKIFSSLFNFPIFISMNILGLAVTICIVVGVLAGIIPASIAAKMDPVVAIRSK